MKCTFINLDAATVRRAALEANFALHAPAHWSLQRFRAVDVEAVARRGTAGRLSQKEIACCLSHVDVIAAHETHDAPFLVLEDDALLGPNSCSTLENAVAWLERNGEWDILFPDLCIVEIGVMAQMLARRRRLMAQGRTQLLDPRGLAFSSATSYVVHPRAVAKIMAAAPRDWNTPYDLFLRNLVQDGTLKARYVFPFAMSLEETSNASTIQPGSDARTGYIWYLFRRMIWRDGNYAAHLAELEALTADVDAESLAFGRLWAAMADPAFRPK